MTAIHVPEDVCAAVPHRQVVLTTRNSTGAWYRAFPFDRWDNWAASADWEWGPWCTETGWCQLSIAVTMALREKNTSLRNLVQKVDLKTHFDRLRPQMLPDEVLGND